MVAESRLLGLAVDLSVEDGLRAPSLVEHAVYRVVQEALTNVHKHARTARTAVVLDSAADGIRLVVRNGAATAAAPPASGGGHGLLGIGERGPGGDPRPPRRPRGLTEPSVRTLEGLDAEAGGRGHLDLVRQRHQPSPRADDRMGRPSIRDSRLAGGQCRAQGRRAGAATRPGRTPEKLSAVEVGMCHESDTRTAGGAGTSPVGRRRIRRTMCRAPVASPVDCAESAVVEMHGSGE